MERQPKQTNPYSLSAPFHLPAGKAGVGEMTGRGGGQNVKERDGGQKGAQWMTSFDENIRLFLFLLLFSV